MRLENIKPCPRWAAASSFTYCGVGQSSSGPGAGADAAWLRARVSPFGLSRRRRRRRTDDDANASRGGGDDGDESAEFIRNSFFVFLFKTKNRMRPHHATAAPSEKCYETSRPSPYVYSHPTPAEPRLLSDIEFSRDSRRCESSPALPSDGHHPTLSPPTTKTTHPIAYVIRVTCTHV